MMRFVASPSPLAVGLVGAGPWAAMVHAPVLAAGPETRLAGVWARRTEAAEALATRHGVHAFADYDALVDSCDAVAFAVPPDVQATMAPTAARRGKAVLLEKPIALDLEGAARLADAVGESGVASMIVLTWRYAAAVEDFLREAARLHPAGGRGAFVSGAMLGGPFATPWRLKHGPLLDLGPHVVDLLTAALGPVVGVRAHGDPRGWVGLLLEHEGGAFSEASLCATAKLEPHRAGVEVHGPSGSSEVDCASAVGVDAFFNVRRQFAGAVASGGHPLDVHHGLRLQRILEDASEQLR